jgi:hypothetical protein
VRIAGRSITFHPGTVDRPGRDWATSNLSGARRSFRTPDRNAGVIRHPLPTRGNDYPDVAPSSRRIIDHGMISGRLSAGGSLPGFPTSLDTGLPPSRIRRRTQAADRGAVAPGTGVGVTGALGYGVAGEAPGGGSLPTIPHIRIPRSPITVTAFRRTFDFTSSIPTRGVSGPVR